jgi:ribonuclease Z
MVEKAEENRVPLKYWNRLQKGETIEEDGKIYTPDMVLGPERKGIKLTYCTDTRPVKAIVENAKGSDLFICEGMYGEKDKDIKAREYKHMTFHEAAKLAKEAEVKEMWLTHYSPSLTRPEEFINEARQIFPNTKVGRDKKSTTLEFDKKE